MNMKNDDPTLDIETRESYSLVDSEDSTQKNGHEFSILSNLFLDGLKENQENQLIEPPISEYTHEISFSASGGTYTYQLGMGLYLQKHFNLDPVKWSGCSGGAWVSMIMAMNLDVEETWEDMIEVSESLYSNRLLGCYFRYDRAMWKTFDTVFEGDPNAYERCNNRLTIVSTKLSNLQPAYFNDWHSNTDLCGCLVASALIPFAMTGCPTYKYRDEWYVDGGFTNYLGYYPGPCTKHQTWKSIHRNSSSSIWDLCSNLATYIPNFIKRYTLQDSSNANHNINIPTSSTTSSSSATSNGNQSIDTDCKCDKSIQRLNLTPWKWRDHDILSYNLSIDVPKNRKHFSNGYEDCEAHHDELKDFFHSTTIYGS